MKPKQNRQRRLDNKFVVSDTTIQCIESRSVNCLIDYDSSQYSDSLFRFYSVPNEFSLTNAVVKRKAEFLAGRIAAQKAIYELNGTQSPVPVGKHREPLWPPSIIGSIAHTNRSAICVVSLTENNDFVGVDIETPIQENVACKISASIIDEAEKATIHAIDSSNELTLTIAFSAKESIFKALYPEVRKYFDFDVAKIVDVDTNRKTVQLRLAEDLSARASNGKLFEVSYVIAPDYVLSKIIGSY